MQIFSLFTAVQQWDSNVEDSQALRDKWGGSGATAQRSEANIQVNMFSYQSSTNRDKENIKGIAFFSSLSSN